MKEMIEMYNLSKNNGGNAEKPSLELQVIIYPSSNPMITYQQHLFFTFSIIITQNDTSKNLIK